MKTLKHEMIFLIIILLLSTGCDKVNISKSDNLTTPTPQITLQTPQITLQKKPLNKIDLTQIKHTVPQGRAQDGGLLDEEFNELSIVSDLIAHGKDSIPFLISKLDDETKMDNHAMDFWYEVYVGDIALMILSGFFSEDGITSTIPGFGWDEFLERGNDKESMSEAILRKYIKKHGRKNIKARWQKMWEQNKENIYWDETDNCFRIKKIENE